jgi:hypothetical protein
MKTANDFYTWNENEQNKMQILKKRDKMRVRRGGDPKNIIYKTTVNGTERERERKIIK